MVVQVGRQLHLAWMHCVKLLVERKVRRVRQVLTVKMVLRVLLVLLAQQAHRESKVQLALRVKLVLTERLV